MLFRSETPQARKESESKTLPAPLDEMQSDRPSPFGTPPPHGREGVLLAMSKDYVQALPAHQAKLRSLAYNKAAARFKVSIGETPKAHDVSSYIIQAMMDLQKTGGSTVQYLASKDTTLQDNEAQQVEMVKTLAPESALEAIALKMCVAASETETKGSLKLCNLTVPPLHYRDLGEFVEYLGKLFKQAEFTSDIEFELDKVTSKVNIKSQSLFLIIAFDDYLFKRLGFKASTMKVLGKTVSIITSQMKGESRATLADVHTIFVYSDTIDYQIVGNSKAMLMGVFPVKGAHGEQVSWQFNPLQYIDVPKSNIPSITMKLCTPTGEPAPFLKGDTLCRVHFRRKML